MVKKYVLNRHDCFLSFSFIFILIIAFCFDFSNKMFGHFWNMKCCIQFTIDEVEKIRQEIFMLHNQNRWQVKPKVWCVYTIRFKTVWAIWWKEKRRRQQRLFITSFMNKSSLKFFATMCIINKKKSSERE